MRPENREKYYFIIFGVVIAIIASFGFAKYSTHTEMNKVQDQLDNALEGKVDKSVLDSLRENVGDNINQIENVENTLVNIQKKGVVSKTVPTHNPTHEDGGSDEVTVTGGMMASNISFTTSGAVTATTFRSGGAQISGGNVTGASGNISQWTNNSGYITGIGGENLNDLADVNAPAPNNNEVLTWNAGANEWQATLVPPGAEVDPIYSANAFATGMDQDVDSTASPTFGGLSLNGDLDMTGNNISNLPGLSMNGDIDMNGNDVVDISNISMNGNIDLNGNDIIDIDDITASGTITDGTASLTGGALTGATGNISMWTNDAGYLAVEADPVFTAWDKSTGISITESQISDLQSYLLAGDNVSVLVNDSGYLTAETDPVFTAWDKSTGISITESQISDLGSYIETTFLGLGSLADPNANRLMGWDDTDNSTQWFTLGSGLSYDHPTHTISGSGVLVESDPVYSANTYAVGMDQDVDTTASPTFTGLTVNGQSSFSSASYPVIYSERTSALTNAARNAAVFQHTTSSDMVDNFGVTVDWAIEDDAGIRNVIGTIRALRAGADNTGNIDIQPYAAGSATTALTLKSTTEAVMPGWLNMGATTAATSAGQISASRLYLNSTAYLDGATAGKITAATTNGTIGFEITNSTSNGHLRLSGNDAPTGSSNKAVVLQFGDAADSVRSQMGHYDNTLYAGGAGTNFFLYSDGEIALHAGAASVAQAPAMTLETNGGINLGTAVTASADGQLGLDRIYLNATAYLDGAAAGVAALTGKLGIGTATVPHGAIGVAMLALDGTNASTNGPHIQVTTATDDYPLYQNLNYSHDNMSFNFDAYWDGGWKSSDVGSNFSLQKYNDRLQIWSGTGVAQGGVVTWTQGWYTDTGGNIIPAVDSARNLGSSTGPLYWANTYTDRLYLNSTAYLDGAVAGTVLVTGGANTMTVTSSSQSNSTFSTTSAAANAYSIISVGSEAGTDTTAGIRFKNDATGWHIGTHTDDSFAISHSYGGIMTSVVMSVTGYAGSGVVLIDRDLTVNRQVAPAADSTGSVGTSAVYFANTYTDNLYLNPTAYISGAAAGQLDVTGAAATGALRIRNATGQMIRFTYNAGAFPNNDLVIDSSGNLSFTGAVNALSFGRSDSYVANAYITRPYLNATAYLDGAVAGQINIGTGVTGAAPTPLINFNDYYDNSGNPSVSHIDLYGGFYGFGISGSTLNYISDQYHKFYDYGDLANPIFSMDGNTKTSTFGGNILPSADSANNLGSSGPLYFANSYIDRMYLNSTAYLDGAVAGRANLTGMLGLGAGNIITYDGATGSAVTVVGSATDEGITITGGSAGASVSYLGNTYATNFRGTLYLTPGNPGTTGTKDGFLMLGSNGATRWEMDRTGHLYPVADSTSNVGSSSYYVANTYSDNLYLNGTAYLSGGTAGQVTSNGTFMVTGASSYVNNTAYMGMLYNGSNGIRYGFDSNDFLDMRNTVQYWQINGGWEYVIDASGFYPYTDSTNSVGTSSYYFANTYTDRLYLNSTAYLDGATAGALRTVGELRPDSAGGAALGDSTYYWSAVFAAGHYGAYYDPVGTAGVDYTGVPAGGITVSKGILTAAADSSARYKENITNYDSDFMKVLDLQLKSFNYTDEAIASGHGIVGTKIGYIAEDLDGLGLTDVVQYDKNGRPESYNPYYLSYYTIEVLKAQQNQIGDIQAQLNSVSASSIKKATDSFNALKNQMFNLEQLVNGLPSGSEIATKSELTYLTNNITFNDATDGLVIQKDVTFAKNVTVEGDLEVKGELKTEWKDMQKLTEDPDISQWGEAEIGRIWFNSTDSVIRMWNGKEVKEIKFSD